MKNLLDKILGVLFALTLWASPLAGQEIPISVQGVVRNTDGSVFPTGNYSMRFRIYTVATGGTAIWTEEQNGIRIEGGVYSVLVGKVTPLGSIPFNQTLYLGVSVDGGIELSPRATFTAAPAARYALRSPGSTPAGMVVAYAGPLSQVPDGWLPCDGRALKSTDFPTLYDRIGTTYGNGSAGMGAGSGTNFNAPDLRAEFIRGLDRGRGVDANRTVGSFQNWATASPANKLLVTLQSGGSHTHSFASINGSGVGSSYATIRALLIGNAFLHNAGSTVIPGIIQTAGAHTHTVSVAGGGDAETRPVNTAVHYFIKY